MASNDDDDLDFNSPQAAQPSSDGTDPVYTPTYANTPKEASMASLMGQMERFQVDVFLRALQKGGGRSFLNRFKSSKGAPASPADGATFTVEDMLSFSPQTIPVSLLKLSSDHQSRAVKMFNGILKYQGETGESLTEVDLLTIATKLIQNGLKRPELRDELYAQLSKQTRSNPTPDSAVRAWELMVAVCSTMPPSKEFVGYISEYIHQCAHDDSLSTDIKAMAKRSWDSLKRCAKAGARRSVPTPEELQALLAGQKLTTIVFFMDDTFEELPYDCTTTVLEAVEVLAQVIKLQNFQTFSLFECRKIVGGKTNMAEPIPDEHIFLDDNRYIADVLGEFRAHKASTRESVQYKVMFKKRMFRETDEAITEPMFVNLSYVQSQHDYLIGNYPVGRDDASQLCALQLQADAGSALLNQPEALASVIERYVTKQVLMTRPKEEWLNDVGQRYKALEQFSKEDARLQFLRILRSLPYGNSIFFTVKRIEDPIGLLPGKLIIGINKRGVHFFRPVPKEYLHSAELRDIMQFGSSHSAVFFKMRVAGVLHIFQFETKQGEDICVALQTHINDVMMRRYSKSRAQGGDPRNPAAAGGGGAAGQGNFGPMYEKHVAEMSKVLEDANKRIDEMTAEKRALEDEKGRMEEQLAEAMDRLELAEALQADAATGGEAAMARRVADLNSQLAELKVERDALASGAPAGAGGDAKAAALEGRMAEVKKENLDLSEKIRSMDMVKKQLEKEKEILENKVGRMEKSQDEAYAKLSEEAGKEVITLKEKLKETERKQSELVEELGNITSLYNERQDQFEAQQKDLEELDALRELKEDVQRREAQQAAIIKGQAERVEELEVLYKEEQTLRKRYFNQMEDMKGKIRVYARTRPMSVKELNENQKDVLTIPDDFTLEHPWKDEKKPRSYQFDAVFPGNTSQEAVFEDTKYLVQSAIDGYNVCIFAYGQTGSGKTHTIYGQADNPGLTPRAVEELFRLVERDGSKYSFSMKCYMLELYQDYLQDLLLEMPAKSPGPGKQEVPKLEIKKDQKGMVVVAGATLIPVSSHRELMAVIDGGLKRRHVAGTQMNRESSRSHLVMSVVIEAVNLQTQIATKGKLSFVDLAGSERLKKSQSTGEQLKEAQAINKSLSALGDVISALATDSPHIPYRNHKLTMLMSDSLGGNAKTLMFVNASPTDNNVEETQNSLQYATR